MSDPGPTYLSHIWRSTLLSLKLQRAFALEQGTHALCLLGGLCARERGYDSSAIAALLECRWCGAYSDPVFTMYLEDVQFVDSTPEAHV